MRECTFKCSRRSFFDFASYITESNRVGRFYYTISCKAGSKSAAAASREHGGRGWARREAGGGQRAAEATGTRSG